MITVYSTGCPKCLQLEKKLSSCNIDFIINSDVDTMKRLGIQTVPYMEVNGHLLNFNESWKWIKENSNNER